MVGGDLTLRGVRLTETDDTGKTDEKVAFGASASVRASMLFPIFQTMKVPGTDNQDGHLGLSIGARYYYQKVDQEKLLFGDISDPDGTPIDFKKSYGAFTAESEFDVYKYLKLRLEYFRPFNNRDALDDVFKASIVVSPKTNTSESAFTRRRVSGPEPVALLASTASMAHVTDDDYVTLGLTAAQKGDWEEAYGQFQNALALRKHPVLYLFSAAAAARSGDPFHAYEDASNSGLSAASTYGKEKAQIMEWAYPSVAGSDRDCPMRPHDLTYQCAVDRSGALDSLVQHYFHATYADLQSRFDFAEARQHVRCGRVTGLPEPPAFDFLDTEQRCAIRRTFFFYKFPTPPAITLPAPGYVVP